MSEENQDEREAVEASSFSELLDLRVFDVGEVPKPSKPRTTDTARMFQAKSDEQRAQGNEFLAAHYEEWAEMSDYMTTTYFS